MLVNAAAHEILASAQNSAMLTHAVAPTILAPVPLPLMLANTAVHIQLAFAPAPARNIYVDDLRTHHAESA